MNYTRRTWLTTAGAIGLGAALTRCGGGDPLNPATTDAASAPLADAARSRRTPPKVVNGNEQMPIDGNSLAYTFKDADAPGRKREQFFDNNGSRGIYLDGWFAGTFGPFVPWDTPGSAKRNGTG